MSERSESQPQEPHGIVAVSNLPDVYTNNDKKGVTLQFSNLKEIVPSYLQDRVHLHMDEIAALARFGGLENIAINVIDQKDEDVISLGSVGGGEGAGTQVGVAKATVSVADLDELQGRVLVHSERWGSGSINIRKQDLDEVMRNATRGARDAEAVGKFINQKMYEGVLALATEHLKQMEKPDLIMFGFRHGWALGFVAADYGLGALAQMTHVAISSPTLFEAIRVFLIQETVVGVGIALGNRKARRDRNMLMPEDEVVQRLSGPDDLEFIRQGRIFFLKQISKSQRFRNKHPLVHGENMNSLS